jgi:alcohol dehydrogenase class IV
MAANICALQSRTPLHSSLERYSAIARLLTGRKDATAEDGAEWVRALCVDLKVCGLRAWGMALVDLPNVVKKAARASSMQANPLPLTGEELLAVLSAAW